MKVREVGGGEIGALLVSEVVGGVGRRKRGRGGGGGREFFEFLRATIKGSCFNLFCNFSPEIYLFFSPLLFFLFAGEEVGEGEGRREGREGMKNRQIVICFLSFLLPRFIILWLLWLLCLRLLSLTSLQHNRIEREKRRRKQT